MPRFLPETTSLQLDSWHLDDAATLLILCVTATQQVMPCPVCAVCTRRVHSRYTRTLADLPRGTARVRWQLRVRKFVCTNTQRSRRIFTERLPGVVAPWARLTQRLAAWLLAIGLALGRGRWCPSESTFGPYEQPPDAPACGPPPTTPMRPHPAGLRCG